MLTVEEYRDFIGVIVQMSCRNEIAGNNEACSTRTPLVIIGWNYKFLEILHNAKLINL